MNIYRVVCALKSCHEQNKLKSFGDLHDQVKCQHWHWVWLTRLLCLYKLIIQCCRLFWWREVALMITLSLRTFFLSSKVRFALTLMSKGELTLPQSLKLHEHITTNLIPHSLLKLPDILWYITERTILTQTLSATGTMTVMARLFRKLNWMDVLYLITSMFILMLDGIQLPKK